MGSIMCQREKGLTDREFFNREWRTMEMLDSSRIGGVIYAAVRNQHGHVFAFVSPFSSGRDGSFCWKEQDESMGPYDCRCPDRILDLLSPTDNETELEWRAKCRANNDRERAAKERAKRVKPGTIIRFEQPLTFTSGATYDTFKFIERSTFWAVNSNGVGLVTVSLPRWKLSEWEEVSVACST